MRRRYGPADNHSVAVGQRCSCSIWSGRRSVRTSGALFLRSDELGRQLADRSRAAVSPRRRGPARRVLSADRHPKPRLPSEAVVPPELTARFLFIVATHHARTALPPTHPLHLHHSHL